MKIEFKHLLLVQGFLLLVRCKDYVKAWKRLTVKCAPNILTIALKRFQDSVEEIIEVSKTFNEKIRKCSDMTLLSCAYAGIGNVLKNIRRAIPLALGLLCISNPKVGKNIEQTSYQ
ncbi:hypothetical protein JHK87_027092 [Glycine soja]|nr:hypothetical protein JHK87_027092 [Glycine soja]